MERGKLLTGLTLAIGFCTFAVVLAYHRVVDGDLWARLAAGAAVWHGHGVLRHDLFAFTPTLPEWIDHEWGTGVIFFGLLQWLGPVGLMLFKIAAALLAIGFCFAAARLNGARWPTLLALMIPAALTILPGFVPVARSHALTFLFFAVWLWCLELLRQGRRWPVAVMVPVMLVWVNVHGGFVVGLGVLVVYACRVRWARVALLACLAVTCLNPYGIHFWDYLVPALLHPRADITEWSPMPVWGTDAYVGFRILFVLAVVIVAAQWKRRSWLGLILLAVTAAVAWRSRRHAPFFGLTALVFLTPYLEQWLKQELPVLVAHGLVAAFVCVQLLPQASLEPAVPNGFYPVRAVDVLATAKAEGNLAVAFRWGSYAAWRLYPRVRVSVDGRYEEVDPDATFEMNHDFFHKTGKDWDRLLRLHRVDFILAELPARFTVEDLQQRGFERVWVDKTSALLARRELAPALRATQLPDTTVEPLDPTLPAVWLNGP